MTETLRTQLTNQLVDLGGISLNVTMSRASGPPLILLHGIGSRWTSWWPVIDSLSPRFQLFMPDWRGHGDSGKPETGYGFADYQTDLIALVQALSLERPLVAGHSLGGIVTMAALAREPAVFRRVVLEDAPLETGPSVGPQLDEWLALSEMPVADAARYYQQEHPEWSEEDCWRRARSITSTHSGVFREVKQGTEPNEAIDWIAPLAGMSTPILLIHGDADHGSAVDPRHIARFRSEIDGSEAIRIPGGNHFLHRDHRQRFLDAALPFLDHGPE